MFLGWEEYTNYIPKQGNKTRKKVHFLFKREKMKYKINEPLFIWFPKRAYSKYVFNCVEEEKGIIGDYTFPISKSYFFQAGC
jgi:transcription elongation factor GreA-like protein